MSKLWFGSSMRPNPEGEPSYFDVKALPWVVTLEQNWSIIKEEAMKLVAEQDKSFVTSSLIYEKVGTKGTWTNLQFFYWGMKFSGNLEKCPTLHKIVKGIPGVVSAGFSRLEPHSDIPPHHGDTNAAYRCHMGLEIPATLPDCGFKVGGIEKSWEEGKCLVFNDAHEHTAWNHTDKRRIIIMIDVLRPEFMHKKNLICAFILARYVSFFYNRSKFINKMPAVFKTILFAIALGMIYVFKPLYNLLKK
jgi:aspartyl/asparaginyl beta-hydroxylase (cupin superfamily)